MTAIKPAIKVAIKAATNQIDIKETRLSLSAEVMIMPLIEYTSFNVDPDTKRKLITELSRIASEITDIPLEFFTVVIREVSGKEAFGQKGKPLG